MGRAIPLLAFTAACGTTPPAALPSGGGRAADGPEDGPGDGEGEGAGEGEGEGEAEGEGEGEGEGDAPPPIDPTPVGCPVGQYSDHNGCYSLAPGLLTGECHQRLRVRLAAPAVEDLDAVSAWGGVPGRASGEQRAVRVVGRITGLRPGRLEVTEDPERAEDPGGSRVLALDPALPDAGVLGVAVGDPVDVEYAEFREAVRSREGALLRVDLYGLLRISGPPPDPAADPPSFGPLLYALGDPFMPPRRERNLGRLGLTLAPADEQACGWSDVSLEPTPVGMCRIYRRSQALALGPGAAITVLPGQSAEFAQGGRVYRVDSGDTHAVEDGHDDCNVPPRTDLRITYLRPDR